MWEEFKEISSWQEISSWPSWWPVEEGFVRSGDGDWCYASGSQFAQTGGRYNPYADWATSFAATMAQYAGVGYVDPESLELSKNGVFGPRGFQVDYF